MPKQILVDLDFNNVVGPINLKAPVNPNDAARLTDLQAAIEGLAWKDNVRVASTANIVLATPGATIDGITMNTSDRVLVKNQSAPAENGIYIWNGAATLMTRSIDTNTALELLNAVVSVDVGTAGAGTTWRQSSTNITLGTTAINWGTFGTSAPAASESAAGIAEIATQGETDTGTDDLRFVTPLKLANLAGRFRRFTQNIGDGSATTFAVPHNFNTRDVQVQVYRNSGNFDTVEVDVDRTSVNNVQLTFATAPAASAFRVVVQS